MNQPIVSANAKLIRTCITMIVVTIGVYWLVILRPFLVPVLVSVLLSILVSPINFHFESKGFGKVPSILFTLILFLGLIAGILYISFIQISDMIDMWPGFRIKAERMFQEFRVWIGQTFGFKSPSAVNDLGNMSARILQDNGSTALLKTTSILADLVLIPLYMFFMLYYRNFFCTFLYRLLGKDEKKRINRILFRIYDVVHNYLAGLFIVMVIVGALNTISLLVLGIQYAVFFGFFAALLLLIPYIGVMIGSSLPIMMALVTKESPMYAVGVGASFLLIQFLEGNFITPYIVGSKISINPLMAILALLLGGMLWGIAGMVLALPMIAILKVILDHSERLKAFGYILGEPSPDEPPFVFSDQEEEAIEQAVNKDEEPIVTALKDAQIEPLPQGLEPRIHL
ncbi:AI-2E family transporter [Arundinibacter roseus]|uniref:AI-2E family transporter n=1 Tax=Arundinibacter roseus TaxID=2070510 RepID=A0A4R4KBE1_9BACT|nr:AI-2E family transporter [Arundinibacter roseus]TDB65194.1 AI-2E family transporter [Arundinibacter roseus]